MRLTLRAAPAANIGNPADVSPQAGERKKSASTVYVDVDEVQRMMRRYVPRGFARAVAFADHGSSGHGWRG
jgi:hypothetical protein